MLLLVALAVDSANRTGYEYVARRMDVTART